MALGTKEKYWPGSVVTDDFGHLVVVSEGAEVGALGSEEKYWPGSHATDEFGRLVVVGPGGGPIGGGLSEEEVETVAAGVVSGTLTASGKGFVVNGSDASTARPEGFTSIEWQGTVLPENAIDGDTWIDTSSEVE